MQTAAAHQFHLAQVNVIRVIATLDDPALVEFVALLDPIHALAEHTDGFVWRLRTDAENSTGVRLFGDPRFLINLSVWESQEQLWDFAYASRHLDVMRRRRQWAERQPEIGLALWWVRPGLLPTAEAAMDRLELIRALGPTPAAFTFRQPFPPPATSTGRGVGDSSAHDRDSEAGRGTAAGFGGAMALPARPLSR